jgi:myo-inositol 2-dehydrogenase/D-chiro-inositol 1-dehydrogenase
MFNLAIVGAGRIGRIHARNAARHPRLALTHVVDPLAEAATGLAGQTDAKVSSLELALADPNLAGVIVASSTDTHLDYALRAAKAGKAVFCEKPIDLDLGRARAAAADFAGMAAPVFLGFNRRFDPSFRLLRDRLASGEVGSLESLHIISSDPSPPPPSYVAVSGGLFKDMAIHDFDMARWLLGEEPTEVFAAASCLVDPEIGKLGDVDTARTLLRTSSGRLCVISNSRRSGYGYDQRIEAFGARGMLKADNVTESTVQAWTETGRTADRFQNFFLDRYRQAYLDEMDHFAAIVAGEAAPEIGYGDGLAALALAEAAAESVKSGAAVRV